MYDRSEPLYVPIKATGILGVAIIRTARLPTGPRTRLAFTSVDRLIAAMGGQQAWAVMCELAFPLRRSGGLT